MAAPWQDAKDCTRYCSTDVGCEVNRDGVVLAVESKRRHPQVAQPGDQVVIGQQPRHLVQPIFDGSRHSHSLCGGV